jgi:coenzyme F420-reducing hydrogenase delta subunit
MGILDCDRITATKLRKQIETDTIVYDFIADAVLVENEKINRLMADFIEGNELQQEQVEKKYQENLRIQLENERVKNQFRKMDAENLEHAFMNEVEIVGDDPDKPENLASYFYEPEENSDNNCKFIFDEEDTI